MRRRALVQAICWAPVAAWAQAPARPRHKISAAQLHDALSQRFPLRLDVVGLLEIELSAPRLLLVPPRNQLGATLVAQPGGAILGPSGAGELDVVFGLRYEASDRTLRGRDMEVLGLRWPGLPAEVGQTLRTALPSIARQAIGEVVLHTFTPRDLAVADTMGFEPGRFTVQDDGLLVEFTERRRR